MWEYFVVEGFNVVDTVQIINTRDSVGNDWKIYLTQKERYINPIEHKPFTQTFDFTIDTPARLILGPSGELRNVLVYRFDTQKGEHWVMFDNNAPPGGFRYELARVKDIYEDTLFDSRTTFVDMHYYLAQDSADTSGLSQK